MPKPPAASTPLCPAPPAAMSPSDPLEQLNHAFRDAYAARREAVLAALGPALAAIDDSLILRLHGQRRVGPARTRRYHELKTLCHVPLAIQAVVGDDGGPLDEPASTRLTELRRHLDAVDDTLATRGFTDDQLARQRRMLAGSRDLLDHVLAAGTTSTPDLVAFLHAQTADIHANIDDAARDQLGTMHATFSAWQQDMSAEDWPRLLVVVASSHMARTGNVASQYFAVALGQTWEGRFQRDDVHAGKRVLTSEGATDEHSAFALLAMHAFDARAANHFFADEARLGRDVLANAAERLLAVMFATRPDPPPDA